MFVDFKNADGIVFHVLRNIGFHAGHQKRAEEGHQLLLSQIVVRADQIQKQLAAVGDAQAHFPARTDGNREAVGGFDVLHLAICAPLDGQLFSLVDEIDFTVERRITAERTVQYTREQRQFLRFQRIAPRAEQIQRLTVHKEYRFLRFVHDQL